MDRSTVFMVADVEEHKEIVQMLLEYIDIRIDQENNHNLEIVDILLPGSIYFLSTNMSNKWRKF